ncbi:MAG: hypothetical protein WBC06_12435 [Chitinophagaceae bacterium]
MKYKCSAVMLLFIAIFTATNLSAQKEFVQRILLDKPVSAGTLKVFPLVEEPNSYYYLPNKVRLGVDDNGRPQFSFIRYVENVRSGANEKEATIGNGGGYVHLLVGLSVSPDEIKAAEQELKNVNPKGKIVGTVVYRGGTMALITKSVLTNANNTSGETQRRVLGIGPAPVLEGDKIAVSFLLDKTDATLLMESLKTPTPDISFNLNMTLAGYQSPVEFKIEMEWDKIYNHEIFNMGVATPILQAEIGIATQQLKETGAIKVTQIGEDPNMQRLQDVLTNKMIDMCFVPFGREGSPNWSDLAQPLNGGQSFLDRATNQLNNERQRQRENNNRIEDRNREERRYTDEENRRRREENYRRSQQDSSRNNSNAGNNGNSGNAGSSSATAGSQEDSDTTSVGNILSDAPVPVSTTRPARADSAGTAVLTNPANIRPANQPIPDAQPVQQQQEGLQQINIVASFQKKTIKHSGKYTAEAKTYFTTSLTEVFGGNIGKINCKDCIREVNLDDPLYKQRELVCFIDGEISQDFDKFINYVSVSMRKKHQGGDITTDEVRVDRKNFSSEGNNFKLMYGWMAGDNDRKNWLNYEYKTVWNFFGGATVESDWTSTVNPVVPLKAPVKRKTVNIIADPDIIKQNNVRSVTVRVYYKIANGEEQFKQASLNISKQVYGATIDFILPKEKSDYEYEVDWQTGNNQVVKSGRLKTSFDDLFVDTLPK